MEENNKGITSESNADQNPVSANSPNHLPFMDGDDIFLRKKPVNLFITISLAVLAVVLAVVVAKHYYKKLNDQERLKWETGRLDKTAIDGEKAKKHDLFQPLRQNWAKYITSKVVLESKAKSVVKSVYILVENNSPKPLDKVVVNFYSANWNGEASNGKTITLVNIKPGETKKVKVKNDGKTTETFCIIKSIEAPSFSFCFDKDIETAGKADPYCCTTTSD